MIAASEFVQTSGSWVNDRTHGVQFRASFLKATAPTTIERIEKYLGSGMSRGIGPVYAKKLVRAFGEAVFDVTAQEPARLREASGRFTCCLDTQSSKAPSATSASRSMTRSTFPNKSSCELKWNMPQPCEKRGRDLPGTMGFRALTIGSYRRQIAPFTLTAVNREVGWKAAIAEPLLRICHRYA